MTSPDIHYEKLAQDALKGVIRDILKRVEKSGLPGDHHFFIAFDTQGDGVVISKRLKEQYPEEMTIVLQHQFWDLIVEQDKFEIKLSFNEIPERLVVPFAAMKVFFDPSVPYGLQFGLPETADEAPVKNTISEPKTKNDGNTIELSEFTSKQDENSQIHENEDPSIDAEVEIEYDSSNENEEQDSKDQSDALQDSASQKSERQSADILSLDKFRKK
ncbi:MAG: ClpXP protease specificity-enhancing factor SspB [Pseudomonadota bacterium]